MSLEQAPVTAAFLNDLRSRYPCYPTNTPLDLINAPWYIIAAVTFSASNYPDAVPRVFEFVRGSLSSAATIEDHRLLARKLREALFKSGLISGYPKAINSILALHAVMPDELKDVELQRDPTTSLSEYMERGQDLFNLTYGETSEAVQSMLNASYLDLAWFCVLGYGIVYSALPDVISHLETSFTLIAALIAVDTPQQIAWHLKGVVRSGATLEEVRAARGIAIEVAEFSGVMWKNEIPDVEL